MPTPEPTRRPVPRQFLERVSRPLLARLLAPYEAPLVEQYGFPLAALAASAQTDRAHVETLWSLLGAPPPELVPLRDDLLVVADVATPACHETLLSQDRDRALDHDLGAEDCAATARLEHRTLFDTARPQAAGQTGTRSYASFQSSTPRPLPDDPARRESFATRMRQDLVARGRSDFFKVHEWRSASERHMEIVYGRLATARDIIGKTTGGVHDVTDQKTDRTSERAHAVFHEDTFRLEVAGYDWMKELVRRVLGETHFGTQAHFEGGETITLSPLFADLAAALSTDSVPGLRRVDLQELWIDLGGDGAWVGLGARTDAMRGAAASYALRAMSEGKPTEATFLLHLVGKTRPVKLKIASPRRLDFDRRDPSVVRVVRDWLLARGFMTMPGQRSESTSEHAPVGSGGTGDGVASEPALS